MKITPAVSIIIPVYNNLKYTKFCLKSIWQNTSGDYEIIVVNNGSSDETKDYLKHFSQIRAIHNQENLGFARAVNQGLSAARGDYIIILNNDCIVTAEWTQRLLRVAKNKNVGIVGVMSNFARSPQLIKVKNKNISNIPKIAQKIRKKYNNIFFYTTRVVGFCMLIKRALIEKIGGFDSRFGLGTFEDDDFSLRSSLCGYQNAIAKDVFIFHFGSVTFKKENIKFKLLLRENWHKFKDKWGLPNDIPFGEKDYLTKLASKNFTQEELYLPFY
ncbi:MAG: glycosyltransferase family 2 protein [Dethiobacter sp.]|nr:glycosyltransferase family 2 protein [Dethiobacter sp.]